MEAFSGTLLPREIVPASEQFELRLSLFDELKMRQHPEATKYRYALASHSEQWSILRQEPSLAKQAFEEALRWESPVQTFFRTTTRDVVVAGVHIPEGEKVLLFLGAANRDPRRWPDPDRFDIKRNSSGHVGFGMGIHRCIGLPVARLEAEIVLTALAQRFERIEITGQPQRRLNNTLRAWNSLPVTVS